jgi:plasmid rolling circle replication initiator protein Rep
MGKRCVWKVKMPEVLSVFNGQTHTYVVRHRHTGRRDTLIRLSSDDTSKHRHMHDLFANKRRDFFSSETTDLC